MSNQQAKQVIGNILTYVALGFIIAAQVNRYWSSVSTNAAVVTIELEYGLYESCSAGFCFNYDWTPSTTEEYAALVTRVILLVADLSVAIAFIAGFVAFCLSDKQRNTCLTTTGALNIVGGSLIIIAAITYIALALTAFFASNLTQLSLNFYVGYCYSFCWVSGILFIIGGVLQIISTAQERVTVQPNQTVVWTTGQPLATQTTTNYQLPPPIYNQNNQGGYYNPAAAASFPQQEKLRASYPEY